MARMAASISGGTNVVSIELSAFTRAMLVCRGPLKEVNDPAMYVRPSASGTVRNPLPPVDSGLMSQAGLGATVPAYAVGATDRRAVCDVVMVMPEPTNTS